MGPIVGFCFDLVIFFCSVHYKDVFNLFLLPQSKKTKLSFSLPYYSSVSVGVDETEISPLLLTMAMQGLFWRGFDRILQLLAHYGFGVSFLRGWQSNNETRELTGSLIFYGDLIFGASPIIFTFHKYVFRKWGICFILLMWSRCSYITARG